LQGKPKRNFLKKCTLVLAPGSSCEGRGSWCGITHMEEWALGSKLPGVSTHGDLPHWQRCLLKCAATG
jgi:hypothetical protein